MNKREYPVGWWLTFFYDAAEWYHSPPFWHAEARFVPGMPGTVTAALRNSLIPSCD
ncbi:MAG TPA: hypothetical protein VFH22_03940 [Rhodocyclaceae bacterium]|nr:hypothetical protein [Rhodocyclaceae bacterium]